ncbi:MAG: uroporphyrinogen-III synthase [Chloroflexota bacterium]
MSLAGKRVVVTRAPHQAGGLAEILRQRGAEPLLFPCIDVAPPENTAPLDSALQTIEQFEWLVLTSTNTVIALKQRLQFLAIDAARLAHLHVGAVGRRTAKAAASRLHVTVDVVPDEQTAEGLAATLPDMRGKQILLPQSTIARDVLRDTLTASGADVTAVDAYQTVTGSGGMSTDAVKRADAVTFTSPSAVRGFVERCGNLLDLLVACIGPTTAAAAREAGFSNVAEPDSDYSLVGMLNVLEENLLETVP